MEKISEEGKISSLEELEQELPLTLGRHEPELSNNKVTEAELDEILKDNSKMPEFLKKNAADGEIDFKRKI